ncbi:MAG: hypothetical protein FWG05_04020 [Kiritimatiellaeota bacterium]|nr:hypothetical protein [Kiritimatiellota bacterium]
MRIKTDTKKRRLIIRLTLIAVWIGLGVILFVTNRGHTLLVDNRNSEEPAIRAPDMIKVTVDKKGPLEFFRGDRDRFEVGGGTHRIYIEFGDGTPPFEKRFTLPLGPDMFILSIPKMINNIEPCFEVFHTRQESRSDETDDSLGVESGL